jgi:hypothetical protein
MEILPTPVDMTDEEFERVKAEIKAHFASGRHMILPPPGHLDGAPDEMATRRNG